MQVTVRLFWHDQVFPREYGYQVDPDVTDGGAIALNKFAPAISHRRNQEGREISVPAPSLKCPPAGTDPEKTKPR